MGKKASQNRTATPDHTRLPKVNRFQDERDRVNSLAVARLRQLRTQEGSWDKVSENLKINVGLLWNIAHEKRRAPNTVLGALKLSTYRMVKVSAPDATRPPRPRRNWKALSLMLATVLCLKR